MKRAAVALVLGLTLLSCSGPQPETQEAAPPKQDTSVVEMGMEAQKHIGLTVAPATLAQVTEYLHVAGTVQPIDSRIGAVRPLARGRVQEVLAKMGDRVASGQPLALLDNIEAGELVTESQAAQAELQKLKIQQAASARQMERSKRLAEIGATSQKEFELIQAEQNAMLEAIKAQESLLAGLSSKLRRFGLTEADLQQSSITTIRSPFAGVVIQVQVAPGAVVDPGMELFSIGDLSEVWIQAEVYEKDLGRIRMGQSALISVDTYPDEKFSGRVTYISDTLDPKTRAAKVRCVVPNPDLRLKLEMFVAVDVPTTFSRKSLAVPTAAIQQIAGKNIVFIRESEQKFEVREVQVGRVVDEQTEIVAGLAEKELVVIQGAFHLKAVLMSKQLGED
ncbi:MAG: efflux transporter periplasmic adaptor subunit [Acidobacteria bacterium RIFCSPLOWO2_02_FULL_61_28]|nr:MAG: efflux transporter periplasmic adaptor subunit [Acidobacteria bacterium RIFCSPLOWO2_02_FULL_61_28]